MKSRTRENRGITAISLILFFLIVGLICFLIYELVYVDILGIRDLSSNPITTILNEQEDIEQAENENNVQAINPILNENQLAQNEITNNQYFHYYYQQLDENAKIIYKGLEDNIQNMKTGTYKINFGKTFSDLINTEDGEQKLNTAFQSAWNAFTYDYVDVFYIDITKLVLTTQTTSIGNFSTHEVYLSNKENNNYLTKGFTYELLSKELPRLENLRNQIVEILDGYTDYEKVKYVHDWIIDNMQYDTTYQKENIYNIYGALTSGNIVCEGYARVYKYILDGLGIPCVLISGTATNSKGETESHAWNNVYLDEKWYAVDLTWDDPILKGIATLTKDLRYRYFLKGSKEFSKIHKEDGKLSENSIIFTFPVLEKENYEE